MGSQKSQEYCSLVVRLQPNQFRQLQDRGEFQLWEDQVSSRKYMAFSINPNEALSEHNLQIYQFRKLNRAFLVGVHCIFREDEAICSHSQKTLLMVEYLPYSLADLQKRLCLRDGLIVLKAAFAGYRIISYIFGPLLAQEDSIFFTEGGVPKVWCNDLVYRNEPCLRAIRTQQSSVELKHLFQNLQMNGKKIESIKSIVAVVQMSIEEGYPNDLLRRLNFVKSYEQGQQIIEQYCRSNRIELDQWIEINRRQQQQSKKLPLVGSRGFLQRVSSNSNHHNQFKKSLDIRNQNIQYQQRPILPPTQLQPYSRLLGNQQNNSRPVSVKIQYGNVFNNKDAAFVHEIKTETIIKPIELSISKHSYQFQRPVQCSQYPQEYITPLQIQSQNRQSSSKRQSQQRRQSVQQKAEVQSQFRQSEQGQKQEQNFRLNVHQVVSNDSHEEQPIPIHDKTIEMEMTQSKQVDIHIPQKDSWTQFPQFASNKMSKKSSQNYRSQERDKVQVNDLPNTGKVKDRKQPESYIRSKYGDYFVSKEKHQHTSSIEKQMFQRKVTFAEDYGQSSSNHEQQQYKKYTFGKIESDRAVQNDQGNPHKQHEAKRKRKINADQSINDRYSKYVTNRPEKNAAGKREGGQQKQKKEGKRLFEQFRRVLKH